MTKPMIGHSKQASMRRKSVSSDTLLFDLTDKMAVITLNRASSTECHELYPILRGLSRPRSAWLRGARAGPPRPAGVPNGF